MRQQFLILWHHKTSLVTDYTECLHEALFCEKTSARKENLCLPKYDRDLLGPFEDSEFSNSAKQSIKLSWYSYTMFTDLDLKFQRIAETLGILLATTASRADKR